MKHKIIDIIQKILGTNEEIILNLPFREIGINSLQFVQILVAIEDEFNIEIPDEYLDINEVHNVIDLLHIVDSLQ